MSEGPELHDDEAFAAEHALGVLNAGERAAAELRMAREPAFAAHVEAWRERLAPMLDAVASVAPPEGLWPRIERQLPANDNADAGLGARFWRRTAVGAMGLAAASFVAVVMLATQKPQIVVQPPPAPAQVLNARIDTPDGQHLFVAAYDPDRKAVMISSLVPPGTGAGHVHQLWLIPADGKPRSLGFVTPGTSVALPVSAPLAGMTDDKAALAVSVEEPGGSHKDGPTGPVVAVGKLLRI
ncbi:MAG TPA: anti-sigma factor [Phenylobacterium sp.]|nr:anti-sigma factor [Phenylobacterium sp.]